VSGSKSDRSGTPDGAQGPIRRRAGSSSRNVPSDVVIHSYYRKKIAARIAGVLLK
jgi:hypothetical protein